MGKRIATAWHHSGSKQANISSVKRARGMAVSARGIA